MGLPLHRRGRCRRRYPHSEEAAGSTSHARVQTQRELARITSEHPQRGRRHGAAGEAPEAGAADALAADALAETRCGSDALA